MERWLIFAAVLVFAAMVLVGCSVLGKTYAVEYNGAEPFLEGSRSRYRSGNEVKWKLETDPDDNYAMYVDGEQLEPSAFDGNCLTFSFRMPAHPVSVVLMRNHSMIDQTSARVLFSFTDCVMGTPEPGNSFRAVLVREESGELRLDIYEKDYGMEAKERLRSYRAAETLLTTLYDAAERRGMRDWSSRKDLTSIDGRSYACGFSAFGEPFHVSSDLMPADDGETAFSEIRRIVMSSITEETRLTEES